MSVKKKSCAPHSNKQVRLALIHHANQYVITKGYADREGVSTILGLRQPGDRGPQRGLLPLLQMHLSYGIPLNLHLSGTLLESLAWYCPDSFLLINRLRQANLLEIVGSAFSQNVMPCFSAQHNIRQLNEELWMLSRHLDWDLDEIKTFWVPERVWNTDKLAPVLSSQELLNGGYRNVLLDDRHIFPVGEKYEGSARHRFDHSSRPNLDAFKHWEITGGDGLVLIPFSKKLRYLVPPTGPEALHKISELLTWLSTTGAEDTIAVYADDLEKAAGVGGWDHAHESRYEHFLQWLSENDCAKPVLISDWAREHAPAGERKIEPGTFYELAQQWKAGEDYRGWIEDTHCTVQLEYLQKAEQALIEAESRGADKGLIEMGWKHLLHCSYETMWHNPHQSRARRQQESMPLEAWAAALCSHARSCLVIAEAAEWFKQRDYQAHAELKDIDQDGEIELVIKNDKLFAVIAPERGGRLVYLFDLTGDEGRLVVGNVSDDWNLQQELNRYMDQPRNHPGALAEVGHEHDRYQPIITETHGDTACIILRNIQEGSALNGMEKQIRLSTGAQQVCVKYIVPPAVWRLSTEISLAPDYYRLLRDGHNGVEARRGQDWRGWANGVTQAWVRIDQAQSTIWDEPYQRESGHSFNLRVSSFSRNFHLEIGVGEPATELCAKEETDNSKTHPVADPHFMRRYFERHWPAVKSEGLVIRECNITSLSRHHDRLTLEYKLKSGSGNDHSATHSFVGLWREDDRTRMIHQLLERLWRAGFDGRDGLCVPQPLSYSNTLGLLVTGRATGQPLRDWIENPKANWSNVLRRVAEWIAQLHNSQLKVRRRITPEKEIIALETWREELITARQSWLVHERERIAAIIAEIIRQMHRKHKTSTCLIHGDFHPENIIVCDRTVTVIDFEHCAVGEAASDLGYLIGQIDVQADRYWLKQRSESPVDMEKIKQILFAGYTQTRPKDVIVRVPIYQARTYLKHLLYTLRMKGTEDARLVTLWCDKAAECLELKLRVARRGAA